MTTGLIHHRTLNTLPDCESITLENGMLTDLIFDFLESHNECTEENLTAVTTRVGFKRLNTLNLTFKGLNVDIEKLLLIKNIRSCLAVRVTIMHRISDKSIEELEKHFNVNKNCSDSYNYVQ